MKEEELAEEYVRLNCDDSLNSYRGQELKQAFLAGLKAKKKENVELKKKCYKKAVKDYCKLEKENAEMKETVIKMNNVITETFSNLTKAKEIIKNLLRGANPRMEKEAKDFIKE